MIRIDRKDFVNTPAACLDAVRAGDTVVITEGAVAVAELHALSKCSPIQRQIGRSKGLIEIPLAFFEPLPEDELSLWSGDTA